MTSASTDHLRDSDATLLSALRRAAEAEARFLAEHPDQDTWDLTAAQDARDLTEAAGMRWDFVSWQNALEYAEAGELGGIEVRVAEEATKSYGIFVKANGNIKVGAYLGEYGVVMWRDGAKRFPSVAEANAEIERRGWVHDAVGTVPGKTTAYACEVY